MPDISDVFIIDVSGKIGYRNTKHCVCISVSREKFFLINTSHREMYDDFNIKSSDYDFLGGIDRFVSCSMIHEFSPDKIIKKRETLILTIWRELLTKYKIPEFLIRWTRIRLYRN